MRLCTIEHDGAATAALVTEDGRLHPVQELDAKLPSDLFSLLTDGSALERLARAASRTPRSGGLDRRAALARAPFREPTKLIGIGLNYADHAGDLNALLPDEPTFFLRGSHTILDPGAPIPLPRQSNQVTSEAELALIMGSECENVEPARALDHIVAITCVLDQTAEDILLRNLRYATYCKNFRGFFSFGPEVVTLDEIGQRLQGLRIETVRNGDVIRGNWVHNMLTPPAELISFLSSVMPLNPGDVISTGTPGAARIAEGDVMTCRITGLRELTNPVGSRTVAL